MIHIARSRTEMLAVFPENSSDRQVSDTDQKTTPFLTLKSSPTKSSVFWERRHLRRGRRLLASTPRINPTFSGYPQPCVLVCQVDVIGVSEVATDLSARPGLLQRACYRARVAGSHSGGGRRFG